MDLTLEPHPTKRGFFVLLLEGEEWRMLSTTIFGKRPRFPQSPQDEPLSQTFEKWEYHSALRYAIWRLSSQDYPAPHLQKLMQRHCVSSPTIEKILTKLQNEGYLNDEEWLQRYVSSQLRKGKGPQAILAKCREKGFTREEIEPYLHIDEEQQLQVIRHLLHTRYRKHNLSDPSQRQKAFAACLRRGFPIGLVIKAIGQMS